MAKQLRIRDRILLGIAFIDQFLDETIGAGSRAYHARKLGFWTPPKYKPSSLRQTIYRLLSTGDLEKKIIQGEPTLILSGKGLKKLGRKFSYFRLQNKNWDGYWRLVIFDIDEKKKYLRDKLRAKLQELGFGMWQKSIYISPFDLAEDMVEFLHSQKLFGLAYVLTAKHQLMGEARTLAADVWHLNIINDEYQLLIDAMEKFHDFSNIKQSTSLPKICQDYDQLLLKDPCLPQVLLPQDWLAEKARKLLIQTIKTVSTKSAIAEINDTMKED